MSRSSLGRLLAQFFFSVAIGALTSGCASKARLVPAGALSNLSPPGPSTALPTEEDWQESALESPRVSSDVNVTNGVSFELGEFSVTGITEIVVPENAHIIESLESDTVTVEVVKGLQFLGAPPAPMRIAVARRYLGIATQIEDTRLSLATYGEWQNKEGHATIRMTVHVPATIQVVGVSAFSGPSSIGQGEWKELRNRKLTPPLADCYWYGPIEPGVGWLAIPLRPDGAKARAKDGPVL
jgi:hypothetical protein